MQSRRALKSRLKRKGLSLDQAYKPLYKKRDRTNKLEGLDKKLVQKRVNKGRDLERAMTTPKQSRGGVRTKQTTRTH